MLQTYLPFVRSQVSEQRPIYFDSGHTNLFFIYGLISAISKQNRIQLTLFPIRRELKEHALSLTYRSENASALDDMCRLATGFCPHERKGDIVSKQVPSRKEWFNKMTTFDQAIWILNETNARWYAIRQQFPAPQNVHYVETRGPWTSEEPASFEALVDDVAAILGTNRSQVVPQRQQHRTAFQRHHGILASTSTVHRQGTLGAWATSLQDMLSEVRSRASVRQKTNDLRSRASRGKLKKKPNRTTFESIQSLDRFGEGVAESNSSEKRRKKLEAKRRNFIRSRIQRQKQASQEQGDDRGDEGDESDASLIVTQEPSARDEEDTVEALKEELRRVNLELARLRGDQSTSDAKVEAKQERRSLQGLETGYADQPRAGAGKAYSKLGTKALTNLLQARGLALSGSRADIIKRLREDDLRKCPSPKKQQSMQEALNQVQNMPVACQPRFLSRS